MLEAFKRYDYGVAKVTHKFIRASEQIIKFKLTNEAAKRRESH